MIARPEEPAFAEPWQAKAFAMTVLLSERGLFSWSEWSERLGAEIAGGSGAESEYWPCWVAALEGLVAEKGN